MMIRVTGWGGQTNGRMEAVGISGKRGLTWTPQPERTDAHGAHTLTTLCLHRPTRCSPRPSLVFPPSRHIHE